VSDFNLKWFLIRFSNLWVQSTCFNSSSFYRFTLNYFFSKRSNHLSIEIEVLYIYFHCWPTKLFLVEFCPLSFRHSWLTAICIVSNPDNDLIFADRPSGWITLKIISSLTLFTVSFLRMETKLIHSPAIFPVLRRSNVCPLFRDFGSSCVPVPNF
jgi:hypothetical protein